VWAGGGEGGCGGQGRSVREEGIGEREAGGTGMRLGEEGRKRVGEYVAGGSVKGEKDVGREGEDEGKNGSGG